jgi:hypothetical protein
MPDRRAPSKSAREVAAAPGRQPLIWCAPIAASAEALPGNDPLARARAAAADSGCRDQSAWAGGNSCGVKIPNGLQASAHVWGDNQAQVAEVPARQQPGASADKIAPSAQDSVGALGCRWSTATWRRRRRISASLARSERASKASQPKTRSIAR